MTNTTNIETTLQRANKVSVKPLGDGYQADFYRTHKHIATMMSGETGWECPKDAANKTAEREDFRKFAIGHAADIQVEYDPEDRRTPRNTRIPTYADDGMVQVDAANMLTTDIKNLLNESNPYGVEVKDVTMESITPKTMTSKGTSLDLLGITDGKYLNGNWAWADIDMVVTFTAADGTEFPMLYPMELVSGQLKKNRLTKTSFTDGIYEELLAMGKCERRLTAEEKKELAKAQKAAEKAAAESAKDTTEEPKEDTQTEKPKRKRTSKKSKEEQVEG